MNVRFNLIRRAGKTAFVVLLSMSLLAFRYGDGCSIFPSA
jgi:hypothetical protein